MMNNTNLRWYIVALVVVALGLGYAVYTKDSSAPAPLAAKAALNAPLAKGAKPDRATVLKTPAPGATDEESQKYAQIVQAAAVRTNAMTIGGCIVEPVVVSLDKGSSLKIVNPDKVEHAIVFDEQHIYSVEASSTKTIVADFGKGAGIYGFGCDRNPTAAGIILLTAKAPGR